jgi:hypothetical protein
MMRTRRSRAWRIWAKTTEGVKSLEIAALKNLSGYGERHVRKVVNGTGDTLLGTSKGSKVETYKYIRNGGQLRGSRRGS